MRKSAPVTRIGWHKYYSNRFNKTQHPHAEQLALWYLILHLGFDS